MKLRRVVVEEDSKVIYGHTVAYQEVEHPRVASVEAKERLDEALKGKVGDMKEKGWVEGWESIGSSDGRIRRLVSRVRKWMSST